MLGVQLVADELEEPFGFDRDDLKLNRFCDVVRFQCFGILGRMLYGEEPEVDEEGARLDFAGLQGLMSPVATAQIFQSHFTRSQRRRKQEELVGDSLARFQSERVLC